MYRIDNLLFYFTLMVNLFLSVPYWILLTLPLFLCILWFNLLHSSVDYVTVPSFPDRTLYIRWIFGAPAKPPSSKTSKPQKVPNSKHSKPQNVPTLKRLNPKTSQPQNVPTPKHPNSRTSQASNCPKPKNIPTKTSQLQSVLTLLDVETIVYQWKFQKIISQLADLLENK